MFKATLRTFFVTISAMLGLGVGLLLVTLLIAALSDLVEDKFEIKSHYSPTVVSNELSKRKVLSDTAPVILKVNIEGAIGADDLNMHTIRQELIESREEKLKDDRVKALIVHINSPGGTVVDADGIYRALKAYKAQYKVPIYAYVDGLCASGGMYVASAADKIFASDSSLVGSIGVLSPPFFNVFKLMETLGVEAKTLFAGKGKEDLNPFRPWRPDEDQAMQSIIDYYYQNFVDIITSNRTAIAKETLVKDYGAKVFPAPKAQELGYIDAVNNSLNDVLKLLAKEIGIEDASYQVVMLERKISVTELLKKGSPMMTGKITHHLDIAPELDAKLMNQFLYLYLP